ncbi:Glycoside Hydrolase Family 16 protein, CBM8 containing [Pseudohyphozyma bogoriensis]|nr:Glycoside Hydrolase Family 16 protein, CBM8 containing [Pseudohyphozyma bogoriensis]
MPVCRSTNYTFTDTSRIETNATGWNGNATQFDWTLDALDNNKSSIVQNDELVLMLTEAGGGTRLSSTRTMLYGNITASIKSTGALGVVTAFITMSGVKDEIDWEWTGSDIDSEPNQGQSDYFWNGKLTCDVANHTHGGYHNVTDRNGTYHVYGVYWGPDELQWTIDGVVVRTLTKASTNSSSDVGQFSYPQTPSRIQMSVWPAGINGTNTGTIEWAGGMIDWTESDYVSQGYFAAYVQWVNVECYDDSDLPFISANSTASSNSTNSTSTKRNLWDWDGEDQHLWKRENTINSYVYGVNDSVGQIGVSTSDRQTVINSATSTGIQMTITNNKSAVANWWADQRTIVKVGIVVGGVAALLLTLVCCCTYWARRKDRKKKSYANIDGTTPVLGARKGSKNDHIPLVEKPSTPRSPMYSPDLSVNQSSGYGFSSPASPRPYGGGGGGNGSQVAFSNQYGQYGHQQSVYDQSYAGGGYGNGHSAYGGGYGAAQPGYGSNWQQAGARR